MEEMKDNRVEITVKNAEGDADTIATIICQNNIDYEPKVSVIIPVYNVAKYLKRSFDSLLKQTLHEIEFIVIDDASTDDSLKVLNEYAVMDKRITLIKLMKNSGAAVARNIGLEQAKGLFLGFVDPDDSIEENFYEELYKSAVKENADIVKCDVIYTNEKGVSTKSSLNEEIRKTKYAFKHEWWSAIYSSSLIYDNKIDFPADCPKGQDGIFLIKALLNSKKLYVTGNTTYNYFRRNDSLDANKIPYESIQSAMRVKSRMLEYINQSGLIKKEDDYIYAYNIRLLSIFYNFYQNDTLQAQELCIKTLVEAFNACKNIRKLKKVFPYKKMIEYILSNNVKELTRLIRQNKTLSYFENKKMKSYQYVFSIFNDYIGNEKVKFIYLFGIKFRIKNKDLFENNDLIISLTTYPARIKTVHIAIESLINQTYKADKIILWLSDTQFPNKEDDLPNELLNLRSKGLEIGWYHQEVDYRPYNKLVNTLAKYPSAYVITADDDIVYDQNCVKSLVETYKKNPRCIIANRAHYIVFDKSKTICKYNAWEKESNCSIPSFNLFLTGVGTVLYFPNCFHKDILNSNLFMKLCRNTDDIWFWAMAVLKGTKIKLAEPHHSVLKYIENTQEFGLWGNENQSGGNDKNLSLMFAYYPKLLRRLSTGISCYKHMGEKIFSIKNHESRDEQWYKVITLLGLKLKYKDKKLTQCKSLMRLNDRLNFQDHKINTQINKIKEQEGKLKAQTNRINELSEEIEKQITNNQNKIDKLKKDYNQKLSTEKSKLIYQLHKYLPEEKCAEALKDWYFEKTGEVLNLENPQTFNEKIQWMKLYDSTPIKTQLADKYLVRDWVKEKIGEEYLIPLLGVYDSFDEIDFDKLPNQFVIKCNHGSGYNILVKDKSQFDKENARKKINTWMNEDFAFRAGFELHYSNIPRKIIIEQFIENAGDDLYDYKFWCFDGKVDYIQFLSERNTAGLKMGFYDRDWNKQDFVYSFPLDTKTIEKPSNLGQMIELVEKLAKGFNHVRVDFYRLDNGQLLFGEMTFTSASGTCKWNDEKINKLFGKKIKLPKLAYNIDTREYYKLSET